MELRVGGSGVESAWPGLDGWYYLSSPRDSYEGDVGGSVDDDDGDDDDDGGIGPPAEHSDSLYRLRCLSCGLPVTASQTDSAGANLAFKKGNSKSSLPTTL
uniref:Uncharacterized protein n=1 Tax=Vespula pensylvanica TaxID=30213 RepID=A0A834KQK6_VESPE|nr:hypothetical protein H0235_013629 [Vespula pensylvanica]